MTVAPPGPATVERPAPGRAPTPRRGRAAPLSDAGAGGRPRTARLSAWTVTRGVLLTGDLTAAITAGMVGGLTLLPSVGYAGATVLLLLVDGAHHPRTTPWVGTRLPRLALGPLMPLPLLLLVGDAGTAVTVVALGAGLVLAARLLGAAGLRALHQRGRVAEPTVIVGVDDVGVALARILGERPELGMRAVGVLDAVRATAADTPWLGRASDLPEVVAADGITRVLVAFPAPEGPGATPESWGSARRVDGELAAALRRARDLGASIWVVPRLPELGMAVPLGHLDDVGGIPVVPLRRAGRVGAVVKRTVDLVGAAVLLLLTAPIVLVAAGMTAVVDGRPAWYRQPRIIRGGAIAPITKVRTVRRGVGAEMLWSVGREHCGSLGRWLRRTHVDELPQLLGVLRGQLSLVGPRPERPSYAATFAATIPCYVDRQRVRAGMTGWAQVHGLVGDTSVADRTRFDNHYIEYWSLWLDVLILVRTLAGLHSPSEQVADRITHPPTGGAT